MLFFLHYLETTYKFCDIDYINIQKIYFSFPTVILMQYTFK